jgi:hypothetical protein
MHETVQVDSKTNVMKNRCTVVFFMFSALVAICQEPINQTQGEDDWWLPEYVEPTENSGFIFYGETAEDYYKENIGIVYVRWKDIHPEEGVFDWTELLDGLNGDIPIHYRMDLSDTLAVPQWVFEKYPDLANLMINDGGPYEDVFGNTSPNTHVPFWHPGVSSELELLRLEFKDQDFASHPNFHHAYFPFAYAYGEYGRPEDEYLIQSGLTTPQEYLDWFYQFTDDWIDAFNGNNQKMVFTGADVEFNGGSTLFRDEVGRLPATYIVQNGIGARTGLLEKFNFVMTDLPNYGTSLQEIDGRIYAVTDDSNPFILNTEKIWSNENEEFCYGNNPCDYYHYKMSILKQLQLRMNWIYSNDVAYDISAELSGYFNLTAGKTIEDSPDAWCALRKSIDRYVNWTYFPNMQDLEQHNWERWLVQREVSSNGQTVDVYDIDDEPFRLFNGTSFEAKRTDRASENDYIYFDVNDGFLNGGENRVMVKMTYLDNSSNPFFLEYSASDGNSFKSIEIPNSNDGAWKTVSLEINDASFDNSQDENMDFRIYNGGIDDITLRFVRVIKLDNPLSNVSGDLEEQRLRIYPNPSQSRVNIDTPNHASRVEIADITGRKVFSGAFYQKKFTIDMSDFNSGVYFIRIFDLMSNEFVVKKIVRE